MLGGRNTISSLLLHPGARAVAAGVLVFTSLAVFLPAATHATLDTPQILSYQGRLTDAQKVTVADGSQNVKFAIFDAVAAGNCLWSAGDDAGDRVDTTFSQAVDCPGNLPSTAISVSVTDGLFNVLLGAAPQNALPDSLFNTASSRWLEITVNGETLSPRRKMASSATALQAGNASLLDGFNTSQAGGAGDFVPVTNAGVLTLTGNITTTGNISATGTGTVSSAGLLTGSLGLTVSGAIVSLNNDSDFAINIGTGTSTGTISLGGTGAQTIDVGTGIAAKTITIGNANDDTFSINSSGLDVSNTGALSGITTLGMSGQLTSTQATGSAPFVVASTTKVSNLNVDSLDSLDSTAFLRSDVSDSFDGVHNQTLSIISSLTAGNRLTPVLSVTQANDGSNNNTEVLAQIVQSDTGSSAHALQITQAGSGSALDIISGSLTSAGAITTTNNISTTGAGTITSAGLLSGNLGLTVTGAVVSLNASSDFGVNIATGTSTGTITLGGTGTQAIDIGTGVAAKTITIGNGVNDPTAINSSTLAIASNGISSWNNAGGNLTIQTLTSGTMALDSVGALNLGTVAATSVSVSRSGITTTVNGALTSSQLLTGNLGLTVTGAAVSLNDSSDFGVSLAGGTSTGTITLGGSMGQTIDIGTGVASKIITIGNANDDFFAINSSGLDVTSAGALSGITTLGMSGQLTSTLATGSAPFVVASTTKVSNLNVDTFDDLDSASFLRSDASDSFDGLNSKTLSLLSTLTAGNRTAAVLSVSQANDAANNNTGVLAEIIQLDTASSAHALQITQSGSGSALNIISGSLTSAGVITTSNNISSTGSGTITSAGLLTGNLGLNVTGATVNLNASSDFGVNIATGTSSGSITLGGTGAQAIDIGANIGTKVIRIGNANDDSFQLDSSGLDVSSGGALSGITTLGMSGQLTSTLATGSAPFVVASTTKVSNLNVDTFDDLDSASFLRSDVSDSFDGAHDKTLEILATVLGGARSEPVLSVQEDSSHANLSTGTLVQIALSNNESSAHALQISNAGIGSAIDIVSGSLTSAGAITTTGNISSTGSGTITSAGLLSGTVGVSVGASQSYSGTGAVTLSSGGTNTTLTLNSATTGNIEIGNDGSAEAINIGSGSAVKTIGIGNGNAGNTINIGTNNAATDFINIGSALDQVTINASSLIYGSDMYFRNGADRTIGITTANPDVAGNQLTVRPGNGNGNSAGGNLVLNGGTSGSDSGNAGNVEVTGGLGISATSNGGDIVLLGGNGSGTGVNGVVRIGSPTIGSTRATNLLAIGGGLEVDGDARLDGNLALATTTSSSVGVVTVGGSRFLHDYGANIFLGSGAGNFTASGTDNIAVGNSAFALLTSGSNNASLGGNAMLALTSGDRNTATGAYALNALDVGIDNAAFGYNALLVNDAGGGNTGIGSYALQSNTSGEFNSGLGSYSLVNTTGDNNTGVGYSTGLTNTTGSRNTFVGVGADVASSGLMNASAIGYQAQVGCGNCMVLGSVNGFNGAVVSTNVGIGDTTPAAMLTVGDGDLFQVTSAGLISTTPSSDAVALTLTGTNVSSANLLYLNSKNTSGTIQNIAYGTATTLSGSLVGSALDLKTGVTNVTQSVSGMVLTLPGATTATGTEAIKGISIESPGAVASVSGTPTWTGLDLTMPDITQAGGVLTSTGIKITGGTVTSGTSYALIADSAAGNVGIGTTTPTANLAVKGSVATGGNGTIETGASISDIGGTTDANATTFIFGSSTTFSTSLVVGDEISFSSAPATYAVVTAIYGDTMLATDIALGDGSTQTINVRHPYNVVTGSGTAFLTEIRPGDVMTIVSFLAPSETVVRVVTDTLAVVGGYFEGPYTPLFPGAMFTVRRPIMNIADVDATAHLVVHGDGTLRVGTSEPVSASKNIMSISSDVSFGNGDYASLMLNSSLSYSSANGNTFSGIDSNISSGGGGVGQPVMSMIGMDARPYRTSGSGGSVVGVRATPYVIGGAGPSDMIGVEAGEMTASGGGYISNATGVYIRQQTIGQSSNVGIAIESAQGTGAKTVWVSSRDDITSAEGGIFFGASADTNLYRSAVSTLKTDGALIVAPPARTGLSPSILTVTGAADTALTASAEATDINFNLARTVQFATGAITNQRAMRIQAPTYAFVGASTITNAATLSISGAPVAGTNATITNSAALVVESGNVGIGTSSPSAKLVVVPGALTGDPAVIIDSPDFVSMRLDRGAVSDDAAIRFATAGSDEWLVGTGRNGSNADFSFFNSGVNQLLITDGTGRVSIGGVASPGSKLVVKSSSTTSATSALNVTDSADTSLFFVRDDGTVSVGSSSSPVVGSRLAVNGSGMVHGTVAEYVLSSTKYKKLGMGVLNVGTPAGAIPGFGLEIGTRNAAITLDQLGTGDLNFSVNSSGAGNYVDSDIKMTILPSGNVGIGTTAPSQLFSVGTGATSNFTVTSAGNTVVAGSLNANGNTVIGNATADELTVTATILDDLNLLQMSNHTIGNINGGNGLLTIKGGNSTSSSYNGDAVTLKAGNGYAGSGSVGTNGGAFTVTLGAGGDGANSGATLIPGYAGGNGSAFVITAAAGGKGGDMTQPGGGGTPGAGGNGSVIQINGASGGAGGATTTSNNGANGGAGSMIQIVGGNGGNATGITGGTGGNGGNGGTVTIAGGVKGTGGGFGGSDGAIGDITFKTSGTGGTTRLNINGNAGTVSVALGSTASTTAVCSSLGNTTSPTATSVYELRDCSSTPAADYAEQYPVAAGIASGDIVSIGADDVTTIDGDTIKQLVKSSSTYESKLFGIVSDPTKAGDFNSIGYNIDTADNPMPIALVGRVIVKVNDENGPIAVGDAITSSSAAGVGMKSTKPGMIIGRALSAFAGPGAGTIMVFAKAEYFIGATLTSDGVLTYLGDSVTTRAKNTATALVPGYDSEYINFAGSGWDGSAALATSFKISNVTTNASTSKLAIANTAGAEVFSVNQSGDVSIAGKLYLSDKGSTQNSKYIYYDSDASPSDYMRTNAAGWATGSYDFAELFPTKDETLGAGEVVAIDPLYNEHVKRATSSEQNLLLGIISTRPGFLAGEWDKTEKKVPVALAGRVPTKVTVENGPIAIGDALTVSPTRPGFATKATSSATKTIGYALSATSVEGLVIVYVKTENAVPINIATEVAAPQNQGLQIYQDIDFRGFSITNIKAIRGQNWSIDEAGALAVKTTKTGGLIITKTQEAATLDSVIFPIGVDTVVITNPSAHENSEIFLSWQGNPGSVSWVQDKHEGSFSVKLASPTLTGVKLSYWIVDLVDERPIVADPAPVIASEPVQNNTTTLTAPAESTVSTVPAETTTPTAPAEVIVSDPAVVVPPPVVEPTPVVVEPVIEPVVAPAAPAVEPVITPVIEPAPLEPAPTLEEVPAPPADPSSAPEPAESTPTP